MHCDFGDPIWLKNGTKLKENERVKLSSLSLNLFCVQLSDSGIYECRDALDMYKPRTFNLTVNNPGKIKCNKC